MNFFQTYKELTSENYAPDEFHHWCAYATLSACTNRQIWLDIGRFRFFANLYIILVGEAGCGKNTAIGHALSLVRKTGATVVSATRQSKEDLIGTLAASAVEYFDDEGLLQHQTPFLICATEIAQWLAIDPIGMTDVLVSLYDEPDDFVCGTRKHGKEVVKRPYITLLGGVQPDKLARYISAEILSAGFLRRTNFVRAITAKPRKAYLDLNPNYQNLFKTCLSTCVAVSQMRGGMVLDEDAIQWYVKWFETRTVSKHPLVVQYDENCHVQLIKLAMLHALGERVELRVKQEDFDAALDLVSSVKATLPDTLSGIARNPLSLVSQVFVATIQEHGGRLPLRDLRRAMWSYVNTTEFNEVLTHLQNTGQVEQAVLTLKDGTQLPGVRLTQNATSTNA